MSEGWVKVHRKFLEWEWYDNSHMVRLFLHLLLTVNYKEKKWHGVLIKPGQVITSYKHLSSETSLSVQTIRTCLEKLEKTGEVTRKTTNKYTILTIEKYKEFQIKEGDSTSNSTSNQQATNKQLTTTKEGKKERNNPPTPLQGEMDLFNFDNQKKIRPIRPKLSAARYQVIKNKQKNGDYTTKDEDEYILIFEKEQDKIAKRQQIIWKSEEKKEIKN